MQLEEVFSNLPALETERLILRKITMDDAPDIHKYASNSEVSKYVFWETHRSRSDTNDYIRYIVELYENGKLSPWGIEYKEDGRLVGTVDFVNWQPNHRTAEIGYALSKDYWGKGIATEAAKTLIDYGFNNMDLVRIQAKCLVENAGSERVMEKAGMTFEGILRKFIFIKGTHYDVKMYSIINEDA